MRGGAARTIGSLLMLAAAMLVSGCASQHADGDTDVITRDGPPPAFAAIAERYDARVRRLERLWCSVSLRIMGVDQAGDPVDEQAEAYLQVIRPRKVSLEVKKVGETYFYMGSNDTRYWWIDLHSEDRPALVGTHENATPEAFRQLGVPLHPLDLIELMGITPIGSTVNQMGAKVAWSSDGRFIAMRLPGRWGPRDYLLDPETFEPQRIALLSPKGEVAAACELQSPLPVAVRDDVKAEPRMARRFLVDVPPNTTLTMKIEQAENREIKDKPFDFDYLKKIFRVRDVRDVDSERGVGAEGVRPAPAATAPTKVQ